ncbi:MAG: prepilin-type N-terminal cleavage/methylation domain-containing protein [Planctomycetaceae bacterium]|jgi:prepilin-type N-terminal cleavage/methylation domain-containing protein|nr:prepilin-type N-terminal cleavage/methylation domain-containing protein [Planctomycetaceae bacterium]
MKKTIKFAGFTLIELLIVIGLLAALASVLLPSLMGSREDALEGICTYNQAGTLRTLRQYEAMTGQLPDGLHSGLLASDGTNAMSSIADALAANIKQSSDAGAIKGLTTDEVTALNNIGITKLAYGLGNPDGDSNDEILGYQDISTTTNVIHVVDGWLSDGDPFTFNGKSLKVLLGEGYSSIIPLFLSPTTDWDAHKSSGWVKGFSVKLEIPGVCPIPEYAEFAYYVAYIGIREPGVGVTWKTTTENDGAPESLSSLSHFYPASGNSNNIAATLVEAQTAIKNAHTTLNSITLTETGGSITVDTNSGSPGTDTVTYTFYIEVIEEPGAVLLGTSCPECGITNP